MNKKHIHKSKDEKYRDLFALVCTLVCFAVSAFLLAYYFNSQDKYQDFIKKYGSIDQSAFSSNAKN